MRFRGLVYRAHNPQWSWTPLSGEGARRHGGRFNRRGVPALYTSLAPLTAIREALPLGHAGMRIRSDAAGSGADDLNLVMWRWGPHRPDRVVLVDDEGRLSRETGD